MLDASPVGYTIYQGSKPPTGQSVAKAGFQNLVLCAYEYQPPSRFFTNNVNVFHAPMDDGILTDQDLNIAKKAAKFVAFATRSKQPVLVTCHMGCNRSGLVSALALYMLTGLRGSKIVDHLKKHRKCALGNRNFVAFLDTLPARH